MKYFIFPYTQNSEGAIALAKELEGKRVLREGSSYSYQSDHCLINWGASDCPYPQALNKDIRAVLDKRVFFERLKGTGLTPRFLTSFSQAQAPMTHGGFNYPVFCRTQVKGRDGAGIVIADKQSEVVPADLYVEGVEKTHEFRIHVGRLPNGETRFIGCQKKIKKIQTAEMTNIPADSRVWCGDTTAFVWTVGGQAVYIPPVVKSVVLKAFELFPELTFGAFDVIYNQNTARAYAIEINSAPMMTPETAKRYGSFFRDYVDNKNGIAPEPQVTASPEPAPVSVAVAASTPAVSPLTYESVIHDLTYEKIGLKTIIEGYIAHVQG